MAADCERNIRVCNESGGLPLTGASQIKTRKPLTQTELVEFFCCERLGERVDVMPGERP
jgi:hypothetical protein